MKQFCNLLCVLNLQQEHMFQTKPFVSTIEDWSYFEFSYNQLFFHDENKSYSIFHGFRTSIIL